MRQRHAIDFILRGHPERLGQLADLDDAIWRHRDAVNLLPHDKPVYLDNLGNCFVARFERLGLLGDLEDATYWHFVDPTPCGDPDKLVYLRNLGTSFARFRRLVAHDYP